MFFYLQWLKLEEVYEQERQVTNSSTRRGGVLALLLHQTISPDWVEEEKESSDHEMDTENQHNPESPPHNDENNLADEQTVDSHTETHDSKPSLMDVSS